MVIGRQPVLEALREGRPLERIFLQRQAAGELLREIQEEARKAGIPVNLVPVEKLNSLSRAKHQGVIAFGAVIQYVDLQDLLSGIQVRGQQPLLLMLDGITDVRNIGAIARSAWCCGAQGLILPDRGVAPLNEEAIKSSAGALEHIAVCRVDSLLKAVDTLHLNGVQVYSSSMQAERLLQELPLKDPACIIMGSEGKGVQAYLGKASDAHFRIPMAVAFDSFNVSVAAGIIVYEAMKQRLGL